MSSIDKAMNDAKKRYNYQCVFCGDKGEKQVVDGMHVFPRTYKSTLGIGIDLRDESVNIFPGCRKHHRELDMRTSGLIRPPYGRILMILRKTHPEFLSQVFEQIYELIEITKDVLKMSYMSNYEKLG